MGRKTSLSAERVREILRYQPDTGCFFWKIDRVPGAKSGDMAGCLNSDGYVVIWVEGALYYAHRLAWLYMTGAWPTRLDHRDRVRCNNVWSNLRVATQSQNLANRAQSKSASGIRGVEGRDGHWHARIKVRGCKLHLGTYKKQDAAIAAYRAAAKLHFGDFHPDGD
jgi:hypothetical protein